MALAKEKVQLEPQTTICEYVRDEDLSSNGWTVACTKEQPHGQHCGLFELGGLVMDPSYKFNVDGNHDSALVGAVSAEEEA